eukprot:6488614-Amphidinium_carterae.2
MDALSCVRGDGGIIPEGTSSGTARNEGGEAVPEATWTISVSDLKQHNVSTQKHRVPACRLGQKLPKAQCCKANG